MRAKSSLVPVLGLALCALQSATSEPIGLRSCRTVMLRGELNAGQEYGRPIGGGLQAYFQPIASGWILRILPASGPRPQHDYAELATPPYQSVSPLSLSTDFSFRSQDAIGWNPRRFRFATSPSEFKKLFEVWQQFERAGGNSPVSQSSLSVEIAKASVGQLTIQDARLIPGTADQSSMAATVASHFSSTAHTLAQEDGGRTSPLGRILWVKFLLTLDVPNEFRAVPSVTTQIQPCLVS